MGDNLDIAFNNFFEERTAKLTSGQRFHPPYRALVVETNDPLNMHRVRFRCPEIHDFNLPPEECPWAVAYDNSAWMGVIIGSWVWIEFEKHHPYGPIYTGIANPTRRQLYPVPSVYTKTPAPVLAKDDVEIPIRIKVGVDAFEDSTYKGTSGNKIGTPPSDYINEYLPLDGRPMSSGEVDSYGNMDISNSVGYYPVSHDVTPPAAEFDPLIDGSTPFNQNRSRPKPNQPDSKFMLRMSKYGNMIFMGDQGYRWKKQRDGIADSVPIGKLDGEFLGDHDKDRQFEINRWKYVQRLVHEDQPKSHDQRRISFLTRYGHKVELRDTGWNKTRPTEYSDDQRWIGEGPTTHNTTSDHWGYTDSEYKDERWMKFRTKGGHLIELSDVGFDPEKDDYTSRLLMDEINDTDKETAFGTDSRFIRMVTRSGIKFVLDDRNSHSRTAQSDATNNGNIGIGVLIKGRRTPASLVSDQSGSGQSNYPPSSRWLDSSAVTVTGKAGNPVGYYWQIDERINYNHTVWGSPLGAAIELNDKDEYIAICQRIPGLPTKWKYLSDNEFLEKHVADSSFNFQKNTHHFAINHRKEYIRLKTRAGSGGNADYNPDFVEVIPSVGENQGLEMHDGPSGKAWVELIDVEKRGLWLSQEQSLGIWRAKTGTGGKSMAIWIDDGTNNQIELYNNESSGKIQLYCRGNVEIIAGDNVSVQSSKRITLKSQDGVDIDVGGAVYNFTRAGLYMNKDINANQVFARFPEIPVPAHTNGRGVGTPHTSGVSPVAAITANSAKNIIEPTNRAS